MTSYTDEQKRNAFLRAADRIERNPSQYDFNKLVVPSDDGGCGCMWGMVGLELGMFNATNIQVALACGISPPGPGREPTGDLYDFAASRNYFNRTEDAGLAAKAMRAYADARFPNPRRSLVPFSECSWRETALARLRDLPAYQPTLVDADLARAS